MRAATAAIAATALVVSIGIAAALAAPKGAVDDVGGAGSGAGQFGSGGPLGVAVNPTGVGGVGAGDFYAVDAGNHRILRFDSQGDFVAAFGRPGSGKGELDDPQGIAVDPDTGSLYVTDRDNRRIQKFNAQGVFLRMWGWGVRTGAAAFEICTNVQDCGPGNGGTAASAGAGRMATGTASPRVAVDPATGDVYVTDPGNRRVQVFDSSGNFLRAFGFGVIDNAAAFQVCTEATGCRGGSTATGTQDGRFGSNQPVHVAIDDSAAPHVIYLSDSNVSNRVQRIDIGTPSAPVPMPALGSSDAPLLNAPTSGLDVDPSTDNLLVARDPTSGDTVVQEVENPGNTAAPLPAVIESHGTGEGWSGAPGVVADVAADADSDRIYVARSGAQQIAVLGDGTPPTASLAAASVPAAGPSAGTTATVGGAVDPNGSKTYYRFEYRLCPGGTCGAGTFLTAPQPDGLAGNGGVAVTVSQQLTGLLPGETYEYRLVADGFGPPVIADAVSPDPAPATFSTPAIPPAVTLRPAALVTDDSAQLQAEIDPNNSPTTYRFEWGLADCASNPCESVPVPDAAIGAGDEPVVVHETVPDLDPSTTYHYRVVATNEAGPTTTGTGTFRTAAIPGPPAPAPARAFELVSPADKVGGVGVSIWGTRPGDTYRAGLGAWHGERFLPFGYIGSVLVDGAFAFANDPALSERQSDSLGWTSRSPITHPVWNDAFAQGIQVSATTSDFSRVTWITNNETLRFFPETAGWATGSELLQAEWLSDWGGPTSPSRWELIGPTAISQYVDPTGRYFLSEVSADGSLLATTTPAGNDGSSAVVGMAGPGDPTAWSDLESGRSVYAADVSGPLADSFAGTGSRELVNVCTGAGADRTTLPAVTAAGRLAAGACPAPAPGRDARLTSPFGGALASFERNSGFKGGTTDNVVSEDGRRVFFLSPDPLAAGVPKGIADFCRGTGQTTVCPPQLFVRQRAPDGSVTVRWISRAEGGLFGNQEASLTGTVRFEGASADGDKVFFRTNSPLTADDPNGRPATTPGGVTEGTANNDSWDLYLYDLPDDPGADPASGTLTRITAGPTSAADPNNVQDIGSPSGSELGIGILRYLSEDGRRAYFATAAPLPGVGPPANGTITSPSGTPASTDAVNLYLYDAARPHAERWRFVTRLPRSTSGGPDGCSSYGADPSTGVLIGTNTGEITYPGSNVNSPHCVSGTADGALISFWTTGVLLPDDPPATADIYAYDAERDRLWRTSAAQGVPAATYPCGTTGPAAATACYADIGIEGNQRMPIRQAASDPSNPGDRMVFFESRVPLVPEDANDVYDVYQWRNGELSLISTGLPDAKDAMLRGNDVTGRNVYFATRDQLSWQDRDAVLDIYTARIDGGIPQPTEPTVCDVLAEGCQRGGAAPADGSSATTESKPAGNAEPRARRRLSLPALSRAARRAAARTGVLRLRIHTTSAGVVRVTVRGRLAGKRRLLGSARARAATGGPMVVRLPLNRAARRALARGRTLRLTVRAAQAGARPRTVGVQLRRGRRS